MGASESVIANEDYLVGLETGTVAVPAPEAPLVARLRAGERAAFEELVATYQSLVYGLAYRLLGDPEEARDISQETFLKAYRYIGSFRGECGLKTWLYRLTVNQASNQRRWWRRRKKKETLSIDSSHDDESTSYADRLRCSGRSPEQMAIIREREQALLKALDTLKHEYRAAVVLRDIEELSYEEISAALDLPVGTVKSRIARGREELRRRLQEMGV